MRELERLEVEALTLARGQRTLVRALDFTLAAGEAMSITGANGAGKTTLLRALAGYVRPAAGRISYRPLLEERLGAAEGFRAHGFLLGHKDGLEGRRLARDELAFLTAWSGGDELKALETARMLELGPALALPIHRLSAGQRRRLGLIRLVSASRTLWLLDEPFTALDARSRTWLGSIMAEHLNAGGILIAAAHERLPVPARELALSA